MSLADRLAAPPIDPSSQFCTVGKVLEEIAAAHGDTHQDYQALAGALSTASWPAARLADALAEEGYPVEWRHIQAHRRGEHTERQCAAHTVGVTRQRVTS